MNSRSHIGMSSDCTASGRVSNHIDAFIFSLFCGLVTTLLSGLGLVLYL